MKLFGEIILLVAALVALLLVTAVAYISYQEMIGANPFQ